jgi:hypothetical protein
MKSSRVCSPGRDRWFVLADYGQLIMANPWAFAYALETRCSPQKHGKKRTKRPGSDDEILSNPA